MFDHSGIASLPVPRTASDEKLGVGLGTRLTQEGVQTF